MAILLISDKIASRAPNATHLDFGDDTRDNRGRKSRPDDRVRESRRERTDSSRDHWSNKRQVNRHDRSKDEILSQHAIVTLCFGHVYDNYCIVN